MLVRVEELLMRLQALPNHEKLHQALLAACEEAALLPAHERERASRAAEPAQFSATDAEDDELM